MTGKTWLGWGLVIAGIIATGPLVLGRGNPSFRPALDEIAQMSQVERADLKRKYEQYRNLSESERAALRSLHQQLEADRPKGGRYLSTMQDYCDWLKSIDSWQQDELAHIKDPLQRAKRVDHIAQDRHQKALLAEAAHDDDGPLRGGLGRNPISLTEAQLTQIFDVLAQRGTGTTEEEQKEIDSQHGLRRYALQIQSLRRQMPKLEQFFGLVSDSELKEMAEASGNSELLEILTNSSDMPRAARNAIVKRGIVHSTMNLFRQESTAIKDAELQAYFSKLPKEDQDHMLNLRADEFKSVLRMRVLADDPIIAGLKSLGAQFDFAMVLERIGNRGGFPGPNGPGGGRPPREGDRGGPFRPGNGRRGPFGDGPPPRPGDEGGPPPRPGEDDRPPLDGFDNEGPPPRDDRPRPLDGDAPPPRRE